MKIETIKISELKPYPANARKHPKAQIELLKKNIERFGFTTPCLIDKDNEIIAGHGRIEAVKELGWTEVPCVRMENLSKEEVKALRIADNKLAEMAEWDMDLLLPELKELSDEDFDLTGFDKDLIIEPDEKDDEVPEVPEEPKSKLGDLYELGKHRVLCGDSTKAEDVERLMNGQKADMVFTDPPYGMDFTGSVNGDGSRSANSKLKQIQNETGNTLDKIEFINKWLPIVTGLTNRAWYVCYSRHNLKNLLIAIDDNKIPLRNLIIWNKNRQNISNSDYKSKYELILYGWKERMFFGEKGDNDVWEIDKLNKSDLHPTMKPVDLIMKAIQNSSVSEEIVADLFLGSGSTLIASEKTNRVCYGMELDPKYVDVIVQRYVDYVDEPIVKLNGNIIQWEKSQKTQGKTQG